MRVPYPIFASLDEEWKRFVRSRDAAAALARWQRIDPVFCAVSRVDELLAWRFRDEDEGPGLVSLMTRFAHEDRAAARVALQAMLPGLVGLARREGEGDPDAGCDIVALAWERICAGRPVVRASSILWDVRKRLRAERHGVTVALCEEVSAPSAEDEALPRSMVHAIAAEEREGNIRAGSTELVMRTRVEGFRVAELAARWGVSDHCLLQRRARAERRLRQLLDEHVSGASSVRVPSPSPEG